LTKKGGGQIDSGGCRASRNEKNFDKNRLTIVGGTDAEEGEFPHMVNIYLIYSFNKNVCDIK